MSHYIHGTDPAEQQRLSLLNQLLNAKCLAQVRPSPGARVLDVGSGLGQFTQTLAEAVRPAGYVIGIERSPEQLALARALTPPLVEFRQGDAGALPLREDEVGSFDLVHSRFLLEHLPDPLAAVRQMVRAARPGGGRIVLLDDDHSLLQLHPEPEGFAALWPAYMRAFHHNGNDPLTGRRLVSLLHDAGAQPRRAALISWTDCAGALEFPALVRNLVEVIRTARERIVEFGLLPAREFDHALEEIYRWGATQPAAVIWYAVSFAEGIV